MCGIAGFIHFDRTRSVNKAILEEMTGVVCHRGPDGEGHFVRGNVGLGHRRLSIIDLSTGDQPFYNDDRTIALVFNGEIYNYLELKDELTTLGHRFLTTSDTEVILRAYEQWGIECQTRFNGMWAFALWDESRQQMFLSRDRMGEKPLYYSLYDNSFVFGSEIKSLLTFGCPDTYNTEVTELYLSLGFVPAPYSFYKGIFKLRQGHYLIVRDGGVKEHKYWDIPRVDESNMVTDERKVHEAFEALFYDSVRLRMRSDVPFGAFLSGGLDSASVVAAMSEVSRIPINTFTIGFSDKAFDERQLAREVATKFKTDHHEFVVEPDTFDESLVKVLHHYDEPFGDPSAIPVGYVSKIAAQKVKMVLTGDGGDEVLSGYNAYQVEKFAHQYQRIPAFARHTLPRLTTPLKKVVNGSMRYKLNQIERVLHSWNTSFESRLQSKSSWHISDRIQRMTKGLGPQITLSEFISDFFQTYTATDPFYKLMLFQLKVLLPDDFLVKTDRMSMAYSLETRIPFLDHRLVELMVNVSKNIKMRGLERKSVLRRTVGRKLPKSILNAPKKGFNVPLREWFKDRVFEEKLQTLSRGDWGLENKIVAEIVEETRTGKTDFGNFLWILFVYKQWLENSKHITSIQGSR